MIALWASVVVLPSSHIKVRRVALPALPSSSTIFRSLPNPGGVGITSLDGPKLRPHLDSAGKSQARVDRHQPSQPGCYEAANNIKGNSPNAESGTGPSAELSDVHTVPVEPPCDRAGLLYQLH